MLILDTSALQMQMDRVASADVHRGLQMQMEGVINYPQGVLITFFHFLCEKLVRRADFLYLCSAKIGRTSEEKINEFYLVLLSICTIFAPTLRKPAPLKWSIKPIELFLLNKLP